jgi:NRAMP (natural resistance-associated macrophage protein)-like metal ion transporter
MNTSELRALARRLGPGVITGAADDDPSGIATYSQAGSQFRFGLARTLLLTTPLMIGIQMLSARIGWVTGVGLAANIAKLCPRWLIVTLVTLLVVANTINITADIGAMGEAVRLLVGGPVALYVIEFGVLSVLAQVYFSYERTVRILKWLTLALFSYVAVILSVSVPWAQVAREAVMPWAYFPKGVSTNEYASMVVAVLGTTISPTSSSGRRRRKWRTTTAGPNLRRCARTRATSPSICFASRWITTSGCRSRTSSRSAS